MIQKIKKPLSVLLALMMVVSLFAVVPFTASADVGDYVPESDYLTFTAVEAGASVTLNVPTGNSFQYDLNGTGLTDYTLGTEITLANVGDSVRFRGRNTAFNASHHVSIVGKVACSGNVMSLRLDEDGRDQGLSYGCFNYMFSDCAGLISAPELPETTLASHCYECMFFGCTNLTAAPELPATTLATACYSSMFAGCTSLTTAPELWATTLATGCYERMFYACTSLTTAPELPATTLVRNCYSYMFAGCESLTTAPELPATTLVSNCYSRMFYSCSSIKLSETQTAEYSIPYSVPSGGDGTTATDALKNMFYKTGGTFTGTPEINKTYYRPPQKYTVTDESVNGTVTASVNDTDVTEAAQDDAVLLNVAPTEGYQFKSITATCAKNGVEEFSDLVALMGDAVADGCDGVFDGYTFKVEDGEFVIYNGSTLFAELSKSDVSDFQVGDETYVESGDEGWYFTLSHNKITEFYWENNTTGDYFFTNDFESTGTLQPVQVDLTTVAEGSQYSFTMPAKNVTVKAEFEEAAPTPAPAKLILNVGENGKVVMDNGTFGNATDASNITEIPAPVNVADGYKVFIVDGHSVNLVEGGSINIATGGKVSFYPSADNTGKITAIPNEGYICTGWYNGDTRYTTKDTIDYQNISEDMTLTAKFAPKLFPQHSVTLGGDIGVNFYINPAAAGANEQAAVSVEFSWNGQTKTVVAKYDPDEELFKATCDVVAAEVACDITAVATVNGAVQAQTDTYSVQDYAETVYKNPEAYDKKGKPQQLQELAKALLNYGAMAQTVFVEYMKQPVKDPADIVKTVEKTDFNAITADDIAGEATDLNEIANQLGFKYYTSSVLYLSKNTLRLYFTPNTYQDAMPHVNDFKGNQSEYYYYVEKENIAAAELDDQQSFTIGDKNFTFSALDYAKAVVNSGMGDNQKDLAKSLYLYNKAANEYFDDAPAPVHVHTPGTAVQENVVPATCSAAGSYDEVVYCSECNEELSREAKTIDMLAHTIVAVAEVPATTEADGVAAHYECSVCHKLFSDAEGNNETTAEALVIPQIVENVVDLSTLTKGYEAQDGDVLINALDGQKYIRIADGATVKLRNANITCLRNSSGIDIAGLTLLGDATIILEGTNVIRGGYEYCPGIHVPEGKTLTIDGTGSLDVSSNGRGFACGIGSNDGTNCGNIVINGGNITAYAGKAAGIGAKSGSSCGNITINGGTVNATSGDYGAGIGSTLYGKSICGDITINGGIVNATANYEGPGIGSGTSSLLTLKLYFWIKVFKFSSGIGSSEMPRHRLLRRIASRSPSR